MPVRLIEVDLSSMLHLRTPCRRRATSKTTDIQRVWIWVPERCRVGATLYGKKRALTRARGKFLLRQNRLKSCNSLNRSISIILAHRLLLHVRDGTDSRDRARRHAPGEAHGHLLARNFSLLGERSVARSRPRKCRSVLEAEFVGFAGTCPRGTCRAGKRGAQHRLSSRGSCSSLTPFIESDRSDLTDPSIDSPLPATLLRRAFFWLRT